MQTYHLDQCLIRFQKPVGAFQGRMTVNSWNPAGRPLDTAESVANTINNFVNVDNTNLQLWLNGDGWSMIYAGVDPGPFDKTTDHPPSQENLKQDDVVVSILLPSGIQKVELINAQKDMVPGAYESIVTRFNGLRLKDNANPLQPADFAYTTSKVLKQMMDSVRFVMRTSPPYRAYSAGFATANPNANFQFEGAIP